VDTADLEPGYELRNADETWAEIVAVEKVAAKLTAYNLTVAEFQTFYVAANVNAEPVWVHNCRVPPNPNGRRGSPETRAHIDQVATELEATTDFQVTGGAFGQPEVHVPNPAGGLRGGGYPDITATNSVTGQTIHINTIDTLADGFTPTARELRNATRIGENCGGFVCMVPKPQ